jgi:hypothetical protein
MARRDDDESPLADVETYDMAEELCDRMRMAPKNRVKFIDEVMTRCGYAPVQTRETYARVENDDDDERTGDGRWGFNGGGQRKTSSRHRPDDKGDKGDLWRE